MPSGHRNARKDERTNKKNRGSQKGKGDFGPDACFKFWVVSDSFSVVFNGFPESNQQVTMASTGPSLYRTQLPSSQVDRCRRGRVHARRRGRVRGLARPGSGAGPRRWRLGRLELMAEVPLISWGARMHTQSELGVSGDADGSSQESQDPDAAAFPERRCSCEVLSAPRKWPKGSGRGPFKRQPRPLGAPPPALAGLAGLGWRW